MDALQNKEKINVLALWKKNVKSEPRSLNGTDPDLTLLHKQN